MTSVPSIAIDSDSNVYYAYVNNEPVGAGNPPEGHAHVQFGHRDPATNVVTWSTASASKLKVAVPPIKGPFGMSAPSPTPG